MTWRRLRQETGSTIVTALLAAGVMLMLGTALLTIVDAQSRQSGTERSRDRGFNLAESVLTSQAFVLGRSWPDIAPASNPACSAAGAGFADTIGATTPASAAVARLRPNLNRAYAETAYAGATWQVNVCDDVAGRTVWSNTILTQKTWDANDNNLLWVRAQSTVKDTRRVVVGLVRTRDSVLLDSRFGLVAGTVNDDLGQAVMTLRDNVLGGVLSGLFATAPTVAADPSRPVTSPPSSGVTGLRCGLLDVSLPGINTCLTGTLGALGALPLISQLVTGGKVENFPRRVTATSPAGVDRLRAMAVASKTHYQSSPGSTNPATAPACSFAGNTGTRSAQTVVFIENVGASRDEYCSIDVGTGVQFKALVIGSGRVILRGNGVSTGSPVKTIAGPQVNTFSGVVYALNLQRLPLAEGGRGLGDTATPPREVVRIEQGAHVLGGAYTDGRSGRIGIYPPPLDIDKNALVNTLVPCVTVLGLQDCTLRNSLKLLGMDALLTQLTDLVGLTALTNAILGQLNPKRAAYGSAVVSDVDAIERLTVYGASGVVTGSFQDVSPAKPSSTATPAS